MLLDRFNEVSMSFFNRTPEASEPNELLYKIYGCLHYAIIEDKSVLNTHGVRTTIDKENNSIEVCFPAVPVVNPTAIPFEDSEDYYTVKCSVNPTTGYLESQSRSDSIELLAHNCPRVLAKLLNSCEEGRMLAGKSELPEKKR